MYKNMNMISGNVHKLENLFLSSVKQIYTEYFYTSSLIPDYVHQYKCFQEMKQDFLSCTVILSMQG